MAVSLALLALGVVAAHDPGPLSPDPDLDWSYPAYARLSELEPAAGPGAGLAPRRRPRDGARRRAAQRRDPRREPRRSCPDRLAEVLRGRVARIADGGAAGRHRAGTRPPAPARASAGRLDHRARRAARARRARGGRRHRDPDPRASATPRSGPRSTRSSRRPRRCRSCPGSSTSSSLDPAESAGFAAAGIAASVQPSHLGSDAAQARRLWGDRAERSGYAWASIAATGAVLAFGTDAPVEPFDPWPGIALAVRREDPRWPAGTPPFAPGEALTHRARAARRLRRPAAFRPRARSGPADRRPARRHRGHPGRGARRAGRARRRARDHAPVDRPRRRAGRLRGLAGQPVSPASGRLRRPRRRRRASGARRRTAR